MGIGDMVMVRMVSISSSSNDKLERIYHNTKVRCVELRTVAVGIVE